MLDINNLKRINDTLGHRAGDQALRMVANRLNAFCKSAESRFNSVSSVARWGGDEFTIMVSNWGEAQQAQALAQNVLEMLRQPLNLDGQEIFLSASVGIACYPQDASTPEDLLRHAELALHRAKEAGRNLFLFYDNSMRTSLHEDLQLETALHGVLERHELSLAFQPIIRSVDGAMIGVEALLRWQSPIFGTVAPARFIPQLERNRLIVRVGLWVLETACVAVAGLRQSDATPLRLAVNVSAEQLLHPSFVAEVMATLAKSGMAAECLELEITESVLIERATEAAEVLRKLRQLRVRIAADDFGTGYSSLSYLWKFPFNTLKIDRSFVVEMQTDPQVRVIVLSILNLARGLGLEVVAEGVETASQFDLLRALECPLIQGYWTGRPASLASIRERACAPVCAGKGRSPSEQQNAAV